MENLLLSSQSLVLFSAGLLAGGLNSVAGGGSFIAFPALVLTGLPTLTANATNNTVTWIGYLASIRAYRRAIIIKRQEFIAFCCISVIGGIIGSLLLLHIPQALFTKLLPYLLLLATGLFTYNSFILNWLQKRCPDSYLTPNKTIIFAMLLQFLIAVYGGFFGGGCGILMLAMFSLTGMKDIHAMNALKISLNACINGVAMLLFIMAGTVAWSQALLMSFGSILGGYYGVYYLRKLPVSIVRRFIIIVGFSMSAYFFVKSL